MSEARSTITGTIRSLLKRRQADVGSIDETADLYEDLELDSLEVAEFSATLEDDLGSDPFSNGQTPRTVAEVIEFYEK